MQHIVVLVYKWMDAVVIDFYWERICTPLIACNNTIFRHKWMYVEPFDFTIYMLVCLKLHGLCKTTYQEQEQKKLWVGKILLKSTTALGNWQKCSWLKKENYVQDHGKIRTRFHYSYKYNIMVQITGHLALSWKLSNITKMKVDSPMYAWRTFLPKWTFSECKLGNIHIW